METDENLRKQAKMYESVKTRLKTDKNLRKMEENERKIYGNGRKRMKTNENIRKQTKA